MLGFIDTSRSHGSYIVDNYGNEFIDCFGQYGSMPVGWNLIKDYEFLGKVALHKLANSDVLSHQYLYFREKFQSITEDFKYRFFIEGGSAAVENALKVAFDWKLKKKPTLDIEDLDVVHLRRAFHGRGGYTLSLTNTQEDYVAGFPKFRWTRVINPDSPEKLQLSIGEIRSALKKERVAAIILEPIQGEGGDIHFVKEFFEAIRLLSNHYSCLLIFDEIQTGLSTGTWWYYQQLQVTPDILVFGKKTQVCGIACTDRLDEVTDHVFTEETRLNSTWGGNIVDMIRFCIYVDFINNNNLLKTSKELGKDFLKELKKITYLTNVRGVGYLIAFDVPDRENYFIALRKKLWCLKAGQNSIRFRPALTFSLDDINKTIAVLKGL